MPVFTKPVFKEPSFGPLGNIDLSKPLRLPPSINIGGTLSSSNPDIVGAYSSNTSNMKPKYENNNSVDQWDPTKMPIADVLPWVAGVGIILYLTR